MRRMRITKSRCTPGHTKMAHTTQQQHTEKQEESKRKRRGTSSVRAQPRIAIWLNYNERCASFASSSLPLTSCPISPLPAAPAAWRLSVGSTLALNASERGAPQPLSRRTQCQHAWTYLQLACAYQTAVITKRKSNCRHMTTTVL